MAFLSANQSRLIVDAFPISRVVRDWTASMSTSTIERTSIVDTAQVFIPNIDSATLSITTMVDGDTASDGYWAQISGRFAGKANRPVTFTESGFTAGNPAWLADAFQMSASFGSTPTAGVDSSLEFQCTGDVLAGTVLLSGSVTSTSSTAAFDGGAQSTNGAIAHLHVTSVAGTSSPSVAVKIEHSTSGTGSWAELAAFTAATSSSSERIAVPVGTTIRRYVRVTSTVTGTDPAFDVTVAFARS